ncbi:U5 small nuclear ribonucleoprotein 200 kDa helicase-like protein, partial [Trifolium pratense]
NKKELATEAGAAHHAHFKDADEYCKIIAGRVSQGLGFKACLTFAILAAAVVLVADIHSSLSIPYMSVPPPSFLLCSSASCLNKEEITIDEQYKLENRTNVENEDCSGIYSLKSGYNKLIANKTTSDSIKDTRAAYETLLSVIQQQFGGQPLGIIRGAADEILAVLKSDSVNKRKDIEKLVNDIDIPDHVFDQLVSIGKLITDFQEAGDGDVDGGFDSFEDDVGVAVEFEDNEEDDYDERSDVDVVEEEEEEEEDDIGEDSGAMQIGGGMDDEEMEEVDEVFEMNLNVHDIDAYWLQRNISLDFEQQIDPHNCHKLAEEVLKILAEPDDREVENKLLLHLEFDKFRLVKFLLRNKLKIVWCTCLARACDQEEREKIEEEMKGLDLQHILDQLHAMKASPMERQKNLENSIREEAQRLKDGDMDRDRNMRGVGDRDGESEGRRRMLNLNNLAFEQGGLFMANKKCDLPDGSYRHLKKGYQEIHVPALKAKPIDPNEKLVNISSMPDWAQPAFKGMTQLNRVQSKVYETALSKSDNLLLCAPTGAGKTNVAVLTILQEIAQHRNHGGGSIDNSAYKIVYVAPMKALVTEIVGNLSNRLQGYGVKVRELSGDLSLTPQQIEETQIIVTTPEKWDIITRKSGDRIYTQLVKLLIIDEIHLLHDNRGPVLESIIARTVRQIETTKNYIRLVGLSATLPNYEDVAKFLRVDLNKGLFYFDNSYRPVPLSQQFVGITVKKPLQRFRLMNDICYEKVMAVAGKHQVLIFVHSRKETSKTARAIRDAALANDTLGRFLKEDCVSREILHTHTDLVKSSDLKDLLPYGFAIHHAAHTVIIKGTKVYNPEMGAWTELSPIDVTQMLGRAGRPQYDSFGEGIIITGHSELQYYLSLMNQQLPIESQFVSKLADQLNAEVVLGTVQNAREACNWLGYTYLHFLRQDEKMELAKLLDRVPIPIKESLDEPSAKINVLLQSYISQLKLEGLSLTSDMVFITQV